MWNFDSLIDSAWEIQAGKFVPRLFLLYFLFKKKNKKNNWFIKNARFILHCVNGNASQKAVNSAVFKVALIKESECILWVSSIPAFCNRSLLDFLHYWVSVWELSSGQKFLSWSYHLLRAGNVSALMHLLASSLRIAYLLLWGLFILPGWRLLKDFWKKFFFLAWNRHFQIHEVFPVLQEFTERRDVENLEMPLLS